MRPNRLFVPQTMLDVWLSEDRVRVEGEVMITQPEQQRFELTTAVRVVEELTGAGDPHDLVGKVKDLAQLAELGAEHVADSLILGDHAYLCVEGFAGTPMERPDATVVATGSSLDAAARAALGEDRGSNEVDQLARFLQSK